MKLHAARTILLVVFATAGASAQTQAGLESAAGSSSSLTDSQSIKIVRAGSQSPTEGPAEHFTGSVRVEPLFSAHDPARAYGAHVTFEPGARTAWHTHPLGQTLIVTDGTGWIQQWDGQKEEIRKGDVVWIPAGQKHWHGATARTAMSHIAIVEELNGKAVDWMEKVNDAQYGAPLSNKGASSEAGAQPKPSQKAIGDFAPKLAEDTEGGKSLGGRKCQVYGVYTNKHDVTDRLARLLQAERIRVAILRASVPALKREAWYRERLRDGIDTMQEVCLRLMGKKLLVALAMEGKFAADGLQGIDGDEDLLTAMARELVEHRGIGESADSVWRSIGQLHPSAAFWALFPPCACLPPLTCQAPVCNRSANRAEPNSNCSATLELARQTEVCLYRSNRPAHSRDLSEPA